MPPTSRSSTRGSGSASSTSSEQPITGIAETGQDVALAVELPVESSAVDLDVRVRRAQVSDSLRRRDEAEKTNARRASALQRCDGGGGTAASSQHRIEQEEIALSRITGDLEVVVDGLKGVVIAIQSDVTNACRRYESQNSLDHA